METKKIVSNFIDEEILEEYGLLSIHFTRENIEDIPENHLKKRYCSEYITTRKIIENIIKNKDNYINVSDFYDFIAKELEKDYIEDQVEYLNQFKDLLREYSTEYMIK